MIKTKEEILIAVGNVKKDACYAIPANLKKYLKEVWRKPNEEPVNKNNLLLVEDNDGEFSLNYTFDPATTKRWAYIKNILPDE